MKVYIVTPEPFPYGMAAVQRIRCYAKAIMYGGLDCEIVCYRRYPREYVKDDISSVQSKGKSGDIEFSYMGNTPVRHSNPFIRKFWDYMDKLSALRYLKHTVKCGDIILLYCGADVPFTLRLFKIVKSKKAFLIRDLCELPYGTKDESQKTIRNRKITLEKQFPKLDGIIAISETLSDLAKSYCRLDCKIIKIPIMVDFDKYELEDKSMDVDIPYIFHSGTLKEQKDGILGVIEAFGKACQRLDKPIRFIATGTMDKSPHKREIIALINKYNIQNKLFFTGYLTDSELRDKLSHASLVVINKYRTQQNHFCFSTKLGEYMAAGKPVIITNVGEAMNYLKNGENSLVVEAEDNEALTNAIVYAFRNMEQAKEIGDRGKVLCHNSFDYKAQSKVLCDFFKVLN